MYNLFYERKPSMKLVTLCGCNETSTNSDKKSLTYTKRTNLFTSVTDLSNLSLIMQIVITIAVITYRFHCSVTYCQTNLLRSLTVLAISYCLYFNTSDPPRLCAGEVLIIKFKIAQRAMERNEVIRQRTYVTDVAHRVSTLKSRRSSINAFYRS
jgi:hypothetical protein